jgi:hypothetical protein
VREATSAQLVTKGPETIWRVRVHHSVSVLHPAGGPCCRYDALDHFRLSIGIGVYVSFLEFYPTDPTDRPGRHAPVDSDSWLALRGGRLEEGRSGQNAYRAAMESFP